MTCGGCKCRGQTCVIEPPFSHGRTSNCGVEHVGHFENSQSSKVAAKGPTNDADSACIDIVRVESGQRPNGSRLVFKRRRREIIVHAAVPYGSSAWGASSIYDGDNKTKVSNVPAGV